MITIAPMFFAFLRIYTVPWIATSSSLLLLGVYYGFLATLPLGPAQLLYIRTFLLEHKGTENELFGTIKNNKIVIAAISGLAVSQLLFIFSIYCPPLYMLWNKPHILTILGTFSIFFYWHQIKHFEFIQFAQTKYTWYDPKILSVFFNSFFLQTINPVVLPNPVLARLMNLFLFQYSQSFIFLFASIVGWLGGQITFVLLIWLLAFRLERDTPTVYVVLKRLVHRFFSPIVFVLFLAYLRKAPLPFFNRDIVLLNKGTNSYSKTWPSLAFDTSAWNRPLRFAKQFIENKQDHEFNQKVNYNKKQFSQYFFAGCVSDGKRKLSHTYPQSLSQSQTELETYLNISSIAEQNATGIYNEWITARSNRRKQLYNSLINTIDNLDKGVTMESVTQKKLASGILCEKYADQQLDPRLVNLLKGQSLPNEISSPWTFGKKSSLKDNSFQSVETLNSVNILKNNKLREWILTKSQKIDNNFLNKPTQNINDVQVQNNIRIVSRKERIWLCLQDLLKWNIQWFPNKLQFFKQANKHKLVIYQNIQKDVPFWYIDKSVHCQTYKYNPGAPSKTLNEFIQQVRQGQARNTKFVQGSLIGRKRKLFTWNAAQLKEKTPFLLRIEKDSNQLVKVKNVSYSGQKNNLQVSKAQKGGLFAAFINIAKVPLLLAQHNFRRYVKLPIFIILKHIARLLLKQPSELRKDFQELAREEYIFYTDDGREFFSYSEQQISSFELLVNRLQLGLQIRIMCPFELRPWHSGTIKNENLDKKKSAVQPQNGLTNIQTTLSSSYLNLLGIEIETIGGKTKKKPYFWKPAFKAIQLIIKQRLHKQSLKLRKLFTPIYNSLPGYTQSTNVPNKDHQVRIDQTRPILKPDTNLKLSSELPKDNINRLNKNNLLSKKEISSQKINLDTSKISTEVETLSQNAYHQLLRYNSVQERFYTPSYKNYLFKPLQSIQKESNLFGTKSISKEFGIAIRYKLLQLNNFIIQLKRKWIYAQKMIKNLGIEFILLSKKQFRYVCTNMLQVITKLYRIFIYQKTLFTRKIFNYQQFNQHNNADIFNVSQHNQIFPLTQAYVLHKIWQTKLINNSQLTAIWTDWINSPNGLKNDLKYMLIEQGVFPQENNKLTIKAWNNWLQFLPCYTPSFSIWLHIVPDIWRSAVKSQIQHGNIAQRLPVNTNLQNNLTYHNPLFDKANKLFKRVQLNKIYRRCLGSLYDYDYSLIDINRFKIQQNSNQTVDQTSLILNNKAFQNALQPNTTEWGLSRVRQGRLAPKLLSLLDTTDKPEINIFDTQSKYNRLTEYIDADTKLVSHSLLKDQEKSTDFPIVSISDWKSKILSKRLNKIIENVKNIPESRRLDRYLELGQQIIKEDHDFVTSILISKKVLTPAIPSIQDEQNQLFATKILSWRNKIINDRLFMYNLIGSMLKYTGSVQDNKMRNISAVFTPKSRLQQLPSLLTSLSPEDVMLPNISREFRVLECMDFDESTNTILQSMKFNGGKNNWLMQNQSNHNQIIKRFLWPTHRLEDLACMNRFWFGMANQSRFTALRISMYPSQ